jgi:SAM-dependent methyltransferase
MVAQPTPIHKFEPAPLGASAQAHLLGLIYGRFIAQALFAAASLGVADHIAAGTTETAALARAVGAEPSALRRLLRALASYGVLIETAQGQWRLTASGELLRGGVPGSLRDLARFFAAREHGAAWLALDHSVRTGESAFEAVHGTDAWRFALAHPAFDQCFNAAMTSLAGSVHREIADAYDFSGIELLVDVGGGHGKLLECLLARNPQLKGVVFELPHVAAQTQRLLGSSPLADRCRAVAGDFFVDIPVVADAYIMTAVLHDWDDEACVTILRSCRKAMKPNGRLLLGEFVLKPANEPDLGKLVDLEMLVILGRARERTADEFRALLNEADLSLRRVIPLPAGTSLIEAGPRSERLS